MRQLVIDCATEACSVALFENGSMISGTLEMLGRGHAERLVPMIADLPGKGRAEEIAVNVGPGSFTGIRVGIAAAKALGLAWNARVIGYQTPTLVAAIARADTGGAVDVVMAGGHGEWFFQSFDESGAAISPVASLSPESATISSHAALVAGSQAEPLAARRGSGTALPIWPDARRFQLLDRTTATCDPAPAYGRAPDAKLPSRA